MAVMNPLEVIYDPDPPEPEENKPQMESFKLYKNTPGQVFNVILYFLIGIAVSALLAI